MTTVGTQANHDFEIALPRPPTRLPIRSCLWYGSMHGAVHRFLARADIHSGRVPSSQTKRLFKGHRLPRTPHLCQGPLSRAPGRLSLPHAPGKIPHAESDAHHAPTARAGD